MGIYLYKKGDGNWIFGDTLYAECPAGSFRLDTDNDGKISVISLHTGRVNFARCDSTYFLDADGVGYTDLAAFITATDGFFKTGEVTAVIESSEGNPTLLDIPDEIDTTDGTVIYQGYIRGSSYRICQKTIDGATISTLWATGAWVDRVSLFEEPEA